MRKANARSLRTFLLVLGAAACLGYARAEAGASPAGQARKHSSVTVQDVINLAKARVSDEVILAQIRARHASFDLTAEQLIQLKTGSVSERIIRVMMETLPAQRAGDEVASPPKPAVRAAARPKKPQPPSAAPAVAKAGAATAVSSKSESPGTPLQWVAHHDPMGFSVKVPSGWGLLTDRQTGRINIQGPESQQAVIWPMFIPQQQLDSRGAGTILQQLARRVDAGKNWDAPRLAGNTARVFARGQTSGAALMQWRSSAAGTVILLFCVSAPGSLYPASVETFAGILKSFQVLPDPKANSAAPVRRAPPVELVSWVQWTDPREGAFSAAVPQGWNVTGGAFRQSASDVRHRLVVESPDGQVRVAVGDANVGVYTAPSATYTRYGVREGSSMTVGDGSRMQILRFLTAQQFVHQYVASVVSRECGNVRILSENDRQDLAAFAGQRARAQGAPNPSLTAAGVSFSCTWKGREGRGYYAAATVQPFPGRATIWYVDGLYGYLATLERLQQADEIALRVVNSMGINAQWRQQEDRMASNAAAADYARAQEYQARSLHYQADQQRKSADMVGQNGYFERSQADYDEVQRRRENAILGTVDVVGSDGKQFKIDNYSDYHWMNQTHDAIAGTNTETSPGYGWSEMITLP